MTKPGTDACNVSSIQDTQGISHGRNASEHIGNHPGTRGGPKKGPNLVLGHVFPVNGKRFRKFVRMVGNVVIVHGHLGTIPNHPRSLYIFETT